MADERIRQPVKITDPTTDANEAGVDASGNLRVILASNTGVDVGDVDVLSIIPGTGVTNLGKAEDQASANADVGVAAMAVQDAALAALTSADLDYTNLRVDANGALWTHDDVLEAALAGSELQVDIVAALPTGTNTIGNVGGDEVDNAAVSVGGSVLMSGLVFDDVTPVVVDEGDAGYQRMSANRNAYTTIRDAAGNERGVNVTASNELSVLATAQPGVDIGDVDVLSVIPGTGATNLGKAENAASAGGDTGVAVMAIQDAALSALGSIDGDYTHLRVNANGALHVTGGGGGTEYTEDDAAPANPIAGAVSLVRQDTPAGLTTADNDIVTQRGTNFGAGYVQVVTSSGSFVDAFGSAPAPAGEARAHSSSTDTAAGGTLDADTADFGGVTKKLAQIDAWASVPYKATIMSVSNGTETILDVLGGKAGDALVWTPPDKDYYEVAFSANAGFDGFRVEMTNLDNSQAANLYATLYTED